MFHQLSLYNFYDLDPPNDTPDPLMLLYNGAALVLSVSGSKDCDAMAHHLLDLSDVMMVHADLDSRTEIGMADLTQEKHYKNSTAPNSSVRISVFHRPA
jgi:hypothetical protein